MLYRPLPGINHISWQLGHLISSEHSLVDKTAPGKMSPLPAGFAERHKKDQAASDERAGLLSKEEYQKLAKQVRAEAIQIIESATPADYDRPISGVPPFLKTNGEVYLFLGAHWLMHAGQWAVIRRKLGRPPLM
jgi:hypothetical protein